MKDRSERACDATTKEHADAVRIVEYLIDRNGAVEATHEAIARTLGMYRDHGGGVMSVDQKRYGRARNHVRDRIDENGQPCCGYTLEYRRSGKTSILALIDPSGDLGHHATAAIATIRGWVSRERQHHTENQRMLETVELLSDHVLAHKDRDGYRLLQRASIEIERDGTVGPSTMAELNYWLDSLADA